MSIDTRYNCIVFYIDLRKYSKMVDNKNVHIVADIIEDYQELVTNEINNFFDKTQITFEYMGDGILVLLKDEIRSTDNDDLSIKEKINKSINMSIKIKDNVNKFLEQKSESLTNVIIDFGIGLSAGEILERSKKTRNRSIYVSSAINSSVKIGDSQDKSKGNIGIDIKVLDKLALHYNKKNIKTTSLERVEYISMNEYEKLKKN